MCRHPRWRTICGWSVAFSFALFCICAHTSCFWQSEMNGKNEMPCLSGCHVGCVRCAAYFRKENSLIFVFCVMTQLSRCEFIIIQIIPLKFLLVLRFPFGVVQSTGDGLRFALRRLQSRLGLFVLWPFTFSGCFSLINLQNIYASRTHRRLESLFDVARSRWHSP